jgi:hypothetical protein
MKFRFDTNLQVTDHLTTTKGCYAVARREPVFHTEQRNSNTCIKCTNNINNTPNHLTGKGLQSIQHLEMISAIMTR